MRNALYARQSIEKKDSISIETQIEKARAECEAEDSIEIYVDRGFSGKNTNRPDFKRLMQDVQGGLIDRIVVYKLDRFSRSILDFASAWEILSKHHVEFVSVNEKFDTSTPIGKAMLYITIVFAQMERETTAERVTDNYYERVAYGSWPGGPAPYGKKLGRIEDGKGHQIPTLQDTEQSAVVDLIFSRYAQEPDLSLGELARYLTYELKESGPKRASWNNVTLARILKNPVYVQADVDVYAYYQSLGVKITNELSCFTGEHAGILIGKRGANTRKRKEIREATFSIANWQGRVPSEIWLKCQQKLSLNKQIKNTGKGKYTWLSGLIKCGYCGRSFRVICDSIYPGKKLLYCAGRSDNMCNRLVKWHVYQVEEVVEQELIAVLEQSDHKPVEEVVEVNNVTKMQLKEIEEKIENLGQNLMSAKVSDATMELINRELGVLNQKRTEILDEIASQTKRKKVTYEKIDFAALSFEEKKIVARNYLKAVYLYDDECKIEWNV